MNAGTEEYVREFRVGSAEDVILARQQVRDLARGLGFSSLDETRLVTAVSELARNIVVHAGEGRVLVYLCAAGGRDGMKVVFEDHGPGIDNVDRAMQEGFSTVGSLGLGLQGARQLVDEFAIQSTPGQGTTIEIVKWH